MRDFNFIFFVLYLWIDFTNFVYFLLIEMIEYQINWRNEDQK